MVCGGGGDQGKRGVGGGGVIEVAAVWGVDRQGGAIFLTLNKISSLASELVLPYLCLLHVDHT